MATARNLGYRMTSGEVLAFIDDDAFAEPDWLEHLLPFYADPTVGAVGGRQIRRQPGELEEGVDAIGQLQPDGTITGNFAADPGRPVSVDHLLGANMSFRRSVLDRIGGIHEGYGGTCVREETDLCLRVAHAGFRLVYTPDAVVEHLAAPYAKGKRFDLRYVYWAQKNHLIVLIRNFGPTEPIVRRYLSTSIGGAVSSIGERASAAKGRAASHDLCGAVRSTGGAVLRDRGGGRGHGFGDLGRAPSGRGGPHARIPDLYSTDRKADSIPSTVRVRVNCSRTRDRQKPASSGSCSRQWARPASCVANPSASSRSNRNRSSGPVRISGMPPTREARTGRPVDRASMTVRPNGSCQTDGTTTTSEACRGVITSLRPGRNRTLSVANVRSSAW